MKIYMADISITIRQRKIIEAENFEEAKQKANEKRNKIISEIAASYKFKQGQWLEEETITYDQESNQNYVIRSKPIPLSKEVKGE